VTEALASEDSQRVRLANKVSSIYEDERDDLKRKAKEITDRLTSELLRRGIEPPRGHGMWWDDSEDHGGTIEEIEAATRVYLNHKGEAAARRLIREDKRRNIEWWVKVVGSIAALITGLLGALIGVIALLKR
jgi:hypothetical protein